MATGTMWTPTTWTSESTGPRTLTATELAQLRMMLDEQRGFRLEQLAALRRPGTPGPLGSADDEISASLATGAHAALGDIEAALRRMVRGTYGRCTECGTALGLERLEILPQAALCMPCQRRDAADGQPGGGTGSVGGAPVRDTRTGG
ncbi:DnaK suppressor protein [Jatrophihabitans endophyticus]|uniref:DnaK suppressor protein n=1 Tax=Jatrophihabitans endophyticus TaxID=1206085 RepID=A0A1M5G7J8_9ACTN|nr:TraR/DksA C4-type zinc finger protein [Jatrophihabitans endophyticus]SHF99713.1 DnaK suppressor protein [Jatrophihabitans endophyticus]